ncbi:receptor-like protein kinase 7 [Quercus suber]|uniref:Receptor-like protein kinase 7 n=1 Tax=Quercus suber TaxID=58331 RepID=A0AAW0KT81_QUESU
MSSRPYLYHFYFLFCFFSLLAGIQSDDLQILMKLKSTLQTPNANVFNSWESSNSMCKDFAGITCNSGGSVTEIELSNQNLTGVVPLDSICQLQSLEKLSLGFNQFNGPIMADLKKCVKLKYLDLGNNFFSESSIPDISTLGQLQHLYLNNSSFSGTFPWESLHNVTGLIELSVGDNFFEPFQFPDEVLQFTNLTVLYLSNCNIQGTIPTGIGNLKRLTSMELSDNNMTGEIPAEIGNLVNLWQLELYNNSFNGKLPVGLRNLTKLKLFDASRNRLEGDLSELKFLTNAVSLQLFENSLSGQVPAEFGEFKNLVNLSLYRNSFTGPLPQNLGSWAKFDFIDVSENFFTGPIPPNMCKQGTMRGLLMLQNNFTGEIPATYANCPTLRRFRVNNNSLSGTLPAGIWGLPNLNIIDITLNNIEGPITSDIKNAKSLGQLFASSNRLYGELPAEISEATSLVSIQLNDNQISGNIPTNIGDLKQLGALQLQNNKLSGAIPDTIGSCYSLSDINIANNSLSSDIPSSMGSLPTLNSLNLSYNKLSGQIPGSLASLRLSLLDLSHNSLTGLVPQALAIEAYNGSFAGNSGLCSLRISAFPKCPSGSHMPKDVHTLIICLAVGLALLLVALLCCFKLKKSEKDHQNRSLKDESWDFKSFHVLSFTEDEILDSIKQENLIGTGGSGNVYKVAVSNGTTELAVKHIWNTDGKKSQSTTPMLSKRAGKSKQFDAEAIFEYVKYGYTYKVNEKSDVYSFGVVLMELVSGKRPIDPEYGENKDIVSWVSSKIKTRESVLSVVDSRIPEVSKEEVVKVLKIAVLCTATLPTLRPTMRSVVQMLEDAEPGKLVGIAITKDGASKSSRNSGVTGTGKFNPDS